MTGPDNRPIQGACEDRFFRVMSNDAIRRAAEEGRVLCADFDITTRCAGACRYCYTASEDFTHTTMPKEKVFEVIDQIWDCHIRHVTWPGGDPLLHPDFFEIMEYAGRKGLHNFVVTSDQISFKFEIKGDCASCERNEHCFGCRSRAHHFLGDLTASDPKCWLNPEAREFCFS